MRVGVFGGSFDPVHYGHLMLAELSRENCKLDIVRFVPASIPPHKQDQGRADGPHRLAMLDLALGGHSSLSSLDIELMRGGVSYTIETLRSLKQQGADELFLLMGADSLQDFPTWREPKKICQIADLVVVERAGHAPIDFGELSGLVTTEQIARYGNLVTPMPRIEISSSELRRRIARNQSIRFQTPRAVEQYILTHGLYRS